MRYLPILVVLVVACGDAAPVEYVPDDITPPEGVIESTQPPRDPSEPISAPDPLNEDGVLGLVTDYLPGRFLGPGLGGEMFCAHETLGWERNGDVAVAWVWVYCGEYYLYEEELALGTAGAGPAAVHMAKMSDRWIVTFLEQPELGGLYTDSVREMFPAEHADRALSNSVTDRNLQAEAEHAARSRLAS